VELFYPAWCRSDPTRPSTCPSGMYSENTPKFGSERDRFLKRNPVATGNCMHKAGYGLEQTLDFGINTGRTNLTNDLEEQLLA